MSDCSLSPGCGTEKPRFQNHGSTSFLLLASLFGFLLIGCEKVPTFQEITRQDAGKNSPSVSSSTPATVVPETSAEEVKPIDPQPDAAAIIALLTQKSGGGLGDRDIELATKVSSVLAELKSLDAAGSAVTDQGIRLIGQFPELSKVDLSFLQINGAGIEGLQSLSNLRELTLISVTMGNSAGWRHLGKLSQIETLNLTSTNITDADVPNLVSMTGLKDLNISNTALTDAALVHLAKLANLEILRMESNRQIHGVGLKAFVQKKQKPGLRCLHATSTPLNRDGLINVKKMGSLEVFENHSAQLTDQLLFELKGATNLKTLTIGNNQLTDASGLTIRTMRNCEHGNQHISTDASGLTIRTMRNLENLDLSHIPTVTEKLLMSLGPLSELSTLNVTKTSCSVNSVQEFRRLRKNCKVIFDDNASQ